MPGLSLLLPGRDLILKIKQPTSIPITGLPLQQGIPGVLGGSRRFAEGMPSNQPW